MIMDLEYGVVKIMIVEKLHLIFYRMLLGVNNNTSKCMVYGELGRTPLQASIDQNVLNF